MTLYEFAAPLILMAVAAPSVIFVIWRANRLQRKLEKERTESRTRG